MKIIPTVGRMVHYIPQNNTARMPGQPCAAVIAAVLDENTINLTAFDANGHPYAVQNVMLYHGDPEAQTPPEVGYAQWMPYQQGQAAKTEDVTGALTTRVAALEESQKLLQTPAETAPDAPAPAPTAGEPSADAQSAQAPADAPAGDQAPTYPWTCS